MKLTQKLLRYLNRVFDKNPGATLALRLRYDGDMEWMVEDGVLSTVVTGGSGAPLEIDLSGYTIASLADYLEVQPGYSIAYEAGPDLSGLSALALMDGGAQQDSSNGDHLQVYTSLLWAYLEAQAVELSEAREQGLQALQQMSIPSAEDIWLDEHGSYYGVPRRIGEADALYGARIIAEVLRPKGNNKAIEMAIAEATGIDAAQVVDVTSVTSFNTPNRAGYTFFNGLRRHNQDGALASYGLFDVVYGYDLESGDSMEGFAAAVTQLVHRMRDAGTHLRFVSFVAALQEAFPTLGMANTLAIVGSADQQDEYRRGKTHNGEYRRDGSRILLLDGAWVLDGSETLDGIGPPGALLTFSQGLDDMVVDITQSAMSDNYTMISGPFTLDGSWLLDGGHALTGENDAIFLNPPL